MLRNTMKEFMSTVNLISENMICMFGANTEEPEVSICSDCVKVRYWLHACSDFNGIDFTIEADDIKVRYHLVADGWQENTPDTIIGNCVKADIDKLLNVLNVEEETDDIGFGL